MTNLNCQSCPAVNLRTETELNRINNRITLKNNVLNEIGSPNLILLCESYPNGVYIYEIDQPANMGLRASLKKELYGNITDTDFLLNLRNDKIIIHDCAYCPIHKLGRGESTLMRRAATICLKNHNLKLLNDFPEVPIITIFPKNRGYLVLQVPSLHGRISANFPFYNITGLRKKIVELGITLN